MSANAEITGYMEGPYNPRFLKHAIDGFYCQHTTGYGFAGNTGMGWLQVDLKGFFILECVRIPVISEKGHSTSFMKGVEFRFGNETKNGNQELNPIIGYSDSDAMGQIFEFCPKFKLIGRYFIIQRRNIGKLDVGEIQINVK